MVAVDLNADLGEGDAVTPGDLAVMDTVTSVSLACGFHAGSREVMGEAAAACVIRGIAIGAHVSYRDRAGFGRRPVAVATDRLVADITEQCCTLEEETARVDGTVAYVKPHGALYHRMGVDAEVAAAVVDAVLACSIGVLVAQSGTAVVDRARRAGLRVVFEGFPDRGYQADGRLSPRESPGGLVSDPEEVGRRAVSLVNRSGITAVDGSWTPVEVGTVCIHGDSPDAAQNARAVRSALERAGVTVVSFSGPHRPPVPR